MREAFESARQPQPPGAIYSHALQPEGFATLADGTSEVARTTLEATAKNIVVVENAGHRPLAR
jgi:hypothetical protein